MDVKVGPQRRLSTEELMLSKHVSLKDEPSRSGGVQHSTGEEWRNSSIKNEEAGPKQKQCPGVDVSSGESKVGCCKEDS